MLQQPERTDIAQTGKGHGSDNAQIHGQMPADQSAAQEVPDAGADECTEHLNGAAAQEKGEGRAGKTCRQPQSGGGVAAADLLDLIQFGLELFSGLMHALIREFFYETLQTIQLGRIDACADQTQGVRECLLAVETGIDDGQQSDVGDTGDAELFGQRVHGVADAPCAGPAGQEHEPDPSDQGGLDRDACLGDGPVFYMPGVIVPVDVHMIGNNTIFYHNICLPDSFPENLCLYCFCFPPLEYSGTD